MERKPQLELEERINNKVKQRIKDRVNERVNGNFNNNKHNSSNYTQYIHNNINNSKYIHYNTSIDEKFKNSSDYEAMWEITIDKWTRNWNFYRDHLTDNILNKSDMNNKRQKRQTQIDFVELTGQNVNGSATGPQDIFIEHYDCDAEEITNVKYYKMNKISTCNFKPLDLDMTKTEVQFLSKAQAVEIKAYAVAGTIKERVEWCSQPTDYFRANRPSYYVSDAQRTKILDADEVRNKLARINLLKNTR